MGKQVWEPLGEMSFIFSGLSKTSNETMELVNAENGVLEYSIPPPPLIMRFFS